MRQVITISPDILNSTPVFYNTRVPIKNLFDYIKSGDSIESFLEDFPSVQKEQAIRILETAEKIITLNTGLNETAA